MTERAKLKAGREKIVKGLLTWGGGVQKLPSIHLTDKGIRNVQRLAGASPSSHQRYLALL